MRQVYYKITTYIGVLILCLSLGLIIPQKAHAQQAVFTEYEIKAALIFGFIQHITLPKTTMNRAGNKIRVGILGEDPFGTMIDDMFRGRQVHGGRSIEVIRAGRNGSVKNLESCQVIFVASSENEDKINIINYATSKKILTISDRIPTFCSRGGIINFTGNKEEFEINIQAARKNEMIVSSQLLKLIQNK